MNGGKGEGGPPPFRFHPAAEADFERLLDLSIRVLRADLERVGRWDPERRRARMRESFDPAATTRTTPKSPTSTWSRPARGGASAAP